MPTPVEDAVQQGRRFVREGRYDDAISVFRQLLTARDDDASLHEAIGSAYFLAGRNDDAARHFERVTKLVTQPGKALINLGAVYNRAGRFQKAIEVIRRGLQYEKRSVEGYYNLGVAHRKLGQHSMAIAAYKEALRIDPKFVEAHQNLGNVHLDQNQPDQAAAAYRKALEINPDFEKARRGLAEAERVLAGAKRSAAPFGRLVDASRSQKGEDDGLRTLDAAAREYDRRRLHDLSREIETAAADWLAVLRDELDDALAMLEKRLALGVEDGDVAATGGAFAEACETAEAERQGLRRKILELVAHEEIQHSPF